VFRPLAQVQLPSIELSRREFVSSSAILALSLSGPHRDVWEGWQRTNALSGFSFDDQADDYGVASLNMAWALLDGAEPPERPAGAAASSGPMVGALAGASPGARPGCFLPGGPR
jgi:hypothetical protein